MVHTKSITKIIAALGVVAGLGVAALPLASYADSDSETVQITVTVGGSFTITTFGSTGYQGHDTAGAVSLTPALGSPASDTAGARIISNISGTYNMYVGTPYNSSLDTTGLFLDGKNSGNANVNTETIVAVTDNSANLSSTTAQWGYKFNGACNATAVTGLTSGCGNTVNLTGAEANDTNWRTPKEFADSFANPSTSGRQLSTNVVIPNVLGDDYLVTIGSSISSSLTNGNFKGALMFYAATNSI
jgi:hypothetical protein